MNVLSLFDGISCGQVALERAGIQVSNYYASEIDKYCIQITQKNYPNTIQIGDVCSIKAEDYQNIDLLIGGSPCQSFSFASSMDGMITKEKLEITTLEQYLNYKNKGYEFEGQSYLFWEYVRVLSEVKPRYFLLENVKMAKKWQKVITSALGVEPILINSELVSAQSRDRLYWTNIPNVSQPEDKHIYIDDILENDIVHKYLAKTRLDYSNYDKTKVDKSVFKNTPIQIGNSRQFGNAVRSNGKAFTLRRVNPNGIIDENYNIRLFTPIEVERLQTLPDNYTLIEGIKDRDRYEVCGNGWTVDVIAHILSGIAQEKSKVVTA
jgi:site-specific DNA-cytosine methylase